MKFRDNTFALGDDTVINLAEVSYIDIREIEQQKAIVFMTGHRTPIIITGFNALEFVWHLKPGALEGKRLKWPKRAWVLHNVVAHPLMQLFAFFGFYRLAMKIHDGTVPKPSKVRKVHTF